MIMGSCSNGPSGVVGDVLELLWLDEGVGFNNGGGTEVHHQRDRQLVGGVD